MNESRRPQLVDLDHDVRFEPVDEGCGIPIVAFPHPCAATVEHHAHVAIGVDTHESRR